MSGFRKLLEIGDKAIREDLGDYYVIASSTMENYLNCLESGAKEIKQQKERINQLEIALQTLIDVASECDSWESFPPKPLAEAYEVLNI